MTDDGLDRGRDVIEYVADPLPGDRAIMRRYTWVGGECIESITVGSPAPMATVREHEYRLPLR